MEKPQRTVSENDVTTPMRACQEITRQRQLPGRVHTRRILHTQAQ